MSAAGPPRGARPPSGERRKATQGGPASAAGPPRGARPPSEERRKATQGGPASAAGPPRGARPPSGERRKPTQGGPASAAGPPRGARPPSEERPTAEFRCGRVAIVGRPSVGKSTLLNALIGQKLSITSKRSQTTRHSLHGILTEPGRQFVFVDTPGYQTEHRSPLNERMNRAVRASLADVDVVAWVVDASHLVAADRSAIALVPPATPVVIAVNKIDALPDKAALLPRMAELAKLRPGAPIVPISAEAGVQLDALKDELAAHLPQGPPAFADDELTDRDERFLAAEFVREKVFRLVGEEIPYAATVGIDRFEQEGALRRIFASIYVQKASQRAIVLGADGARIKAIASAARHDLERLFGAPVYLEVWVRVKKGWADSASSLDRLGY